MEQRADPLADDPELFELAQAQVEAYSKFGGRSLADDPLCAGCVAMTEQDMAMRGSLGPV